MYHTTLYVSVYIRSFKTLKYFSESTKVFVGEHLAIRGVCYGLAASNGPAKFLSKFWVC